MVFNSSIMKKVLFSFALLGVFFLLSGTPKSENCKNGNYLLEQSILRHDPNTRWDQQKMQLRIQEPRTQNPERFTEIAIDNTEDHFKMIRKVESVVVETVIKGDEVKFLVDGNPRFEEDVAEKYRLYPERALGYKKFYTTMYGLPMTLDNNFVSKIESVDHLDMDNRKVIRIQLLLHEAMISKHWGVLLAPDSYELLGLEFYHPESGDNERETIWFDGNFKKDGILLPRFRHWYLNGKAEYLGSDIIIN